MRKFFISFLFLFAVNSFAQEKNETPNLNNSPYNMPPISFLADRRLNSALPGIKINDYLFFELDQRTRYESVSDESKPKDARANTIRNRLGLRTIEINNFSSFFEFENTTAFGAYDFANSANNKSNQYPTINDPNNSEINQFYIDYYDKKNWFSRIGRQQFSLDDMRYVGNPSWRQNGVSYDAISLVNISSGNLKATYAYLDKIIRSVGVFSAASVYNLNTNLVNLNFSVLKPETTNNFKFNLIPFYYFIENQEIKTESNQVKGLRLDFGKIFDKEKNISANLMLEISQQADYANNINNYSFGYYRVEPSLKFGPFDALLGYESIEGNGVLATQFPIGNAHIFNGWADKFAVIPSNGLNDKYIWLGYKLPKIAALPILDDSSVKIRYHNFDSDNNAISYGEEFDTEFVKNFNKNISLSIKYANYNSQGFAADTDKFFTVLTIKY